MENELAGAMVWSLDTDDFHGDCADLPADGDEERINFPLMHAINDAIREALEDAERNKENVIPHGEPDGDEERRAAGARLEVSGLLVVVYVMFVICYF